MAFCSATPGTGWLPRSPRRCPPLTQRSTPSGNCSLRCGWGLRPARRSCAGRGLFRNGGQPRRAGDGRRPRRSDPAGRVDRGHAQRGRSGRFGATAVARCADSDHCVSAARTGLRRIFRRCERSTPRPGNLRPAQPGWSGATLTVAEIAPAVRSRRLVTLTGVGGVGKTRLALDVAARLASEFPDGVWVFELAAVADPAAVPDAVAAVLGITQQPGKTVTEVGGVRIGGQGPAVWCSTTASTSSMRRRISIEAILEQSTTVRDHGDQP